MKHSRFIACLIAIAGLGAANAAITISGTVQDTSGKALDSIRLSLSVPGGATLARDTTGATGSFSISSDSTTGKLVVRSTSMGSTSYVTKTDTIVVAGKDTAGIVIRLTPTPVAVRSSVSGTVDSAGSANKISGAIVTMRSSGGGGGTTFRDTTGADGAYSFTGITTGVYTISVAAAGYTTKSVTDTVTAAPDTVNVSLAAIVTSSVSGKVDSAGSATVINGAIVTLRSSGAGGGTTLRDTTGADGTYSFTGITTGVYSISVSATGYTTKTVTDTVTTAPDTVNISLIAPITTTVSGKVDSAGSAKLVSGAIVTMRSSTGGGGAATLRDTTGADGTYSFTGVTAGVYTISVSATGYTTKTVTDTVTAAPDTVNVSLVVPVTTTVSGKVDSAGSAKLVSGAIVTMRSSTGGGGAATLRDTTGADGTYSFTGVTTGVYTISVSATGYTTKTVTDTVTAAPNTVNVSLAVPVPALTIVISGMVSDTAGKKLDSVYVSLRSTGNGATTLLRDTTGTDGTFSFKSTYLTGKYVLRLIKLNGAKDTMFSDTITLDSANVNVAIAWGKAKFSGVAKRSAQAIPGVSLANGILTLGSMASEGSVRLLNANGEVLFARSFLPSADVRMEIGRKLSTGNYILSVTQKNAITQKRIVVR